MNPDVFRVGRIAAFFATAVLLFFGLRVPQTIATWEAKQQKIRQVQRENADLEKDLAQKRERVRKLRDDRAEQELEIRRMLRYQREGETSIYIPGPQK
jgi:cell division protein FtsB